MVIVFCLFFFVLVFYSAKMKYDESDNIVIRASRTVTDRVGDLFGMGMGLRHQINH